MYYYSLQAPYLLLIFGLLIALTSGLALSATLKLIIKRWQVVGGGKPNNHLSTRHYTLPFIGVTMGLGLFLCSGLEVFGFTPILACSIGLPTTLLTCWLVWSQLVNMLTSIESQGMISLDLDSLG
ncbi:hypothetical protein [Richelia intracellularis]|jgi:hypothetical protein|nr:hypothetical protein [Richelia intracellularis]HAE06327.1 hypothetical protein [Richelia sp.]